MLKHGPASGAEGEDEAADRRRSPEAGGRIISMMPKRLADACRYILDHETCMAIDAMADDPRRALATTRQALVNAGIEHPDGFLSHRGAFEDVGPNRWTMDGFYHL